MAFEGLKESLERPVLLEFKSVLSPSAKPVVIDTFTSYVFESNILTPASAFRFTSPSVDKAVRKSVRSGDMVQLSVINQLGTRVPVATGFLDETDTHIVPTKVDYVMSGRDVLGQLIDNAAVDANNKIQNIENADLATIMRQVVANTRIPAGFKSQQVPNGKFLFQTNPGETKMNALQRYLDLANCLVWSDANGQLRFGKPDFTKDVVGQLILNSTDPSQNNLIEARVRRNLTHPIRKMVTQLSTLGQVSAGEYTKLNADKDMAAVRKSLVGRSVYKNFNYGNGADAVNQIAFVGNQNAEPRTIGNEHSAREIARENMKVIEVEAIRPGHCNELGQPYAIDQMYDVQIEDEDVREPMYVYQCSHELTMDTGPITRLRLVRKNTICAYGDATKRSQ